MSIVENAVRFAEDIANDNSHGYSQQSRWPEQGSDFDCSSLVIQAWENAGVPVKSKGATYTGNMYSVFMSCGFRDITSQINLNTGSGLQRGDVLLNHVNHTAMVTGPGKIVHARSSEGNSMPGDQSGNEIRIQNYWNYPWDAVLRYPEIAAKSTAKEPKTSLLNKIKNAISGNKPTEAANMPTVSVSETAVKYMPGTFPLLTVSLQAEEREDVKAFQALHNLRFDAQLDIDGYYGPQCYEACKYVQKAYGLEEDGECGKDTWTALINGR